MQRRAWLVVLVAVALVAAACGNDDDDSTTTDATEEATEEATEAAEEATEEATEAAPDEEATEDAGAGGAGGFDVDAALAADLANCAPEPTGGPLIIGYAADFSDLGGFADAPASQAAELFVDLINCAGGVDGVRVELIVEDIQGDPDVTQRAAQDLVDAGAHAILGPPFADFGQPLLQVTGGEVPVLFVASTEPTLPDANVLSFFVAFDDTAQATAAAEFALDQGWETAVTFSSPGPYFGYNPEIFTEVFEAGGGEVIGDFNYVPIEDTDFSTQANEVAALDQTPDVLYTAMLAFQAAILRGQLEAVGVETNYIITDAFEATGGYFEEGVEGFYHTTHSFPEPGSRIVTLGERFEEVNDEPIENLSFGGLAADAILVVIDAFQRSGSTDPAEIGAAIAEGAGVDAVTGTLVYEGTNGTPEKPVYVHQVVDGQPSLAATVG